MPSSSHAPARRRHARGAVDLPALIGMVGLVALLILLGLASASISHVVEESLEVAQERFPKTKFISSAAKEETFSVLLLWDATQYADGGDRRALVEQAVSRENAATTALLKFDPLIVDEEVKRLYQKALDAHAKLLEAKRVFKDEVYGTARSDAVAADLSPRGPGLMSSIHNLQERVMAYEELLEELQGWQNRAVDDSVEETNDRAKAIQMLLAGSWAVVGLTLITFGAAWRKRFHRELTERDAQVAHFKRQRDVLVREVHHRIKNHLQGLLGLIENHQARRPELSADLATLQGQVIALAGVHGVQSKVLGSIVPVTDLVRQQVALLTASIPELAVRLDIPADIESCCVNNECAVPVALIVTELLMNAYKHGEGKIGVNIGHGAAGCAITVHNAIARPLAVDLAADVGLGTGLSLVKSMLHGIGTLSQASSERELSVTILIRPDSLFDRIEDVGAN